MDEQNENGFFDAATPILGFVAGGFVAAKGAEMIGVPEKWAPWGVAAAGVYGALAGQGRVRQAAVGVAAAGISLGVLKAMGMLDYLGAMSTMRQAAAIEPPTPSVPANAITRDELQTALADSAQKTQTQLAQLEERHRAHLMELRNAYQARVDEISAGYDHRLAEKDQTISELLRELRRAQATGPSIVHRDATIAAEGQPPVEPEPVPNVELPTMPPQPDPMAKAQAIREQLSLDENQQLQQLLATASPEVVAFAEAQIASMSADEAVAYLREHVLAPPQAA